MKTLFFTLLFLVSFGTISAQTEGQLTYSMDMSSDNPDMAMAVNMMEGSTMDLYFMKEKSAVSVQMGSLGTMKTITDLEADKGILLMSMMGQNIATEMKSLSKTAEEHKVDFKVEDTKETKKILDFTCTKRIVRDDKGNEMIMWMTNELKPSLKGMEQFSAISDGMALEFSTNQNGMDVHFVATKFSKTVDPKVFSLEIPEGYQVMTEEQMKSMSGM